MPIFCNLVIFLNHRGRKPSLNRHFHPADFIWNCERSLSISTSCCLVLKYKLRSSSVRMTCATVTWPLVLVLVLLCIRDSASLFLPDSSELRKLLSRYEEEAEQKGTSNTAGNRTRRAILWSDREEILQLHNKLRGGVYPTASNMEYMVRLLTYFSIIMQIKLTFYFTLEKNCYTYFLHLNFLFALLEWFCRIHSSVLHLFTLYWTFFSSSV